MRLSQERFRLDIRKGFFILWVVGHWNSPGMWSLHCSGSVWIMLSNTLCDSWGWSCAGLRIGLSDPCGSFLTQGTLWFYYFTAANEQAVWPVTWVPFGWVICCLLHSSIVLISKGLKKNDFICIYFLSRIPTGCSAVRTSLCLKVSKHFWTKIWVFSCINYRNMLSCSSIRNLLFAMQECVTYSLQQRQRSHSCI